MNNLKVGDYVRTKKVDLYVNDEKLKKLEKLKEIEILSVVTQEQLDDRSYKV